MEKGDGGGTVWPLGLRGVWGDQVARFLPLVEMKKGAVEMKKGSGGMGKGSGGMGKGLC